MRLDDILKGGRNAILAALVVAQQPYVAMSTPRAPLLQAYAMQVTSPAPAPKREIALAWGPQASATGHIIYHSNAPGAYNNPLEKITIGSEASYTFTDQPQGQHCFVVTAVNSLGSSGPSQEVCAYMPTRNACDKTGDGKLDDADIKAMRDAVLGIAPCPGYCDINKDDKTDVVDVQLVTNAVLGLGCNTSQ